MVLETDNGKYLEGHSDYSKKSGSLYLTQKNFIFVGGRGGKKWQIMIPLTSIDQSNWNYHEFLIPYIDENRYKTITQIQNKSKSIKIRSSAMD